MVRIAWFIFKLTLIAAIAVWIAGLEGRVNIAFLHNTDGSADRYTSDIDVRFFLFTLLVAVSVIVIINDIARFLMRIPQDVRRHAQLRHHEKGLEALTRGLTSIAAGDAKAAAYQARRAEKFLPAQNGLPLLLKAQAARLRGDETLAEQNFEALLTHEDTSFLGLRGLLQASLSRGDYFRALDLARQASLKHPDQGWIVKTVYELETRARDWDQAMLSLTRAEKMGAIPQDKALRDRIAILMVKAEKARAEGNLKEEKNRIKKAFKYDAAFTPAALQLAKLYMQDGKTRAATRVVEKSWAAGPHPDLVKLWDALQPPHKANDTLSRLHWHERLAALNPDHPESHIMLARIHMDQKFWGDANHHLKQAEEGGAIDARTYRLRAELEDQTTRLDEFVMSWQDKAAMALPEKTWVCTESGRIYDRWHPVAMPHGSFNTIVWDHPHARGDQAGLMTSLMQDTVTEALPEKRAARI